MKWCMVLFVAVAFLTVGCAGISISVDNKSKIVIAKVAARHVGVRTVRTEPKIATQVQTACQVVIESKDIVSAFKNNVVTILNGVTDNPMLIADIADLLELIDVNVFVENEDEYADILKAVCEGLISGINMGGK